MKKLLFLLVAVASLFMLLGCNDGGSLVSKPNSGNGQYSQTISYKKYSLDESPCSWREDRFEHNTNTVVVINNTEELESYIKCRGGNYPAVDFTKKTLLLAIGLEGYQNMPDSVNIKKTTERGYVMEVNLLPSLAPAIMIWQVPVVVEKIAENSVVELIVTRKAKG